MAEIRLFHHAQGLTAGVVDFADELRLAGHAVHVPDLYEGRLFPNIDEAVPSLPDYDEAAARLLLERVLGFLAGID